MASKIESTAVNELIDRVQQRPLDRDPAADLLFQPPPEAYRRRQVDGTPAPSELWVMNPAPAPVPAGPRPGDAKSASEARRRAALGIATTPRSRGGLAGFLVVAGLVGGAALALSRLRPTSTPTEAPGASLDYIAAFTPPQIAPPPPPALAKPALVAVLLASTPAGATATLLDNTTGTSTQLGSTPVEASLDPTKQYDVRFELAGRRATTQHLDPATHPSLDVALAEPVPEADDAPGAETPAPPAHHRRRPAKKKGHKRVAVRSGDEDAIATVPPRDKPSDEPGIVAITTSTPCAILLDGTNTGKTTPAQLSVPAGHHSIRLIAAAEHINKQISVDVIAQKTTKLNQSF